MAEKLFGTDGIRGVANTYPITPEVALKLGRAVARVLKARHEKQQKVVIGKDTRLSGYMLETAFTSGLVSEGARVLLTGPVPTPAVAHLTRSMGCDAGIMLTASHNPYQDNGIKIFGPDGYKLGDDLEEDVERLLADPNLSGPVEGGRMGKAFRVEDAVGRYIEFVKQRVHATSLEGLKVVVDCANGAGYFVAPLILDELGAEVIRHACSPDGTNINAQCGALHPEDAGQLVRQHGADMAICLDGDADRVIFLDHEGQAIPGDNILCLCAKALKAQGGLRGNTLVSTIMSNLGLRDALAREDILLETTGVGDRKVLERMREGNFALGGENSGHIIFADHATTGDGIMSALQVLGMMKQTGDSLANLAACMTSYPSELVNVPVRNKPPLEEVEGLQAAIQEVEALLGTSGRVLVRYSGTEFKIRLLVEAAEQGHVDQSLLILRKAVETHL